MPARSNVTLFCRSLAALVGTFAILAAASWLGSDVDFTSFGLGAARTSLATSLCLLAESLAIWIMTMRALDQQQRLRAVLFLSLAVLLVAIYDIARHVAGTPNAGNLLGLGTGSMSAATAIAFINLSGAILALVLRRGHLAISLSLLGLAICLTGLVGYTLDRNALEGVTLFRAMSFPTVVTLTLLFLACAFFGVEFGWGRHLIQRGPVRTIFWLLMPISFFLPLLLSFGVLSAIESGIVGVAFSLSVLAVSMTLILGATVLMTCFWLERSDRARARFEAIVQSSDDAILSKTSDGVITSWNKGAETLFGFSEREAVGKTMHIVIPEGRSDEEELILEKIRRGEHVDHFETVRRHKDGHEIDVSATVSPVRVLSGEIIGASSIMRDIGLAKRREEELRRSNAELEQFAYVASHDLQEPLRMVANYTELLANRYRGQLDERADKYIHYATDGARRMQQLVVDLLAYSRVGSQGKPLAPVALQDVVARAVHNLETLIERTGAQVEWSALPRVDGDEVQLDQLFQNLIGNAIKFRGTAAPHVTIGAEQQGRFWRVSVRDNGIGMEMKHAERIFQMFQRLHARGEYDGSGIGLAIAKRIVERHGGRIWAESAPGEGTTMRFTLPAEGQGSSHA